MPTPQQCKQLRDALIDAFPNLQLLEQLLYFGLGKRLNQITQAGDLQHVGFQLIQVAESQGWLLDLVRAARKENPGNVRLEAIARELLSLHTPPIPLVTSPEPSELKSDCGINYTELQKLLKAGQWKEADCETYLVMLQAVGRERGDWIRPDELLNFPCIDLYTIDSLWAKYSNGRFGFNIQKQIYLEVGGKPDGKFYKEAWDKFGDRVGWRVEKSWLSYSSVTFNTSASRGHLPVFTSALLLQVRAGTSLETSFVGMSLVHLFYRIETCRW
ncbi:hypothetical protein NUACC21_46350 [Scytonema sp. NUACC21]